MVARWDYFNIKSTKVRPYQIGNLTKRWIFFSGAYCVLYYIGSPGPLDLPSRQLRQIVSPIIPHSSRCLSPDLPHHQLSDESSQHPPLTSNTAPIVVHRAVSCTTKYFVTSIPGNNP